MSLSVLRGLATAFNASDEKTCQPVLRRGPSRELVMKSLTLDDIIDEPLMVPRKSTSKVFDRLVSQINEGPDCIIDDMDIDDPSAAVRSPWQRIDAIGEGLYICGAAALEQTELLREMGICAVVNCAEASLYTRTDFCSDGKSLAEHLDTFRVETLDAEDVEHCSMTRLWERASKFIDESLQYGGVVVHCAMGVSRSSSTCIAYLMTRHKMSLEDAFRKVFAARDHIMPNVGFWEELRSLEKRCISESAPSSGKKQDVASQVIAMLDLQLQQKREAAMAGW